MYEVQLEIISSFKDLPNLLAMRGVCMPVRFVVEADIFDASNQEFYNPPTTVWVQVKPFLSVDEDSSILTKENDNGYQT